MSKFRLYRNFVYTNIASIPHYFILSHHAGALVYELVSGVQLFQVGNNLGSYQAKLASLHVMDLTGIPIPLQPTLKSMLSPQASVRPNANAFTGAPYFQVNFSTSHFPS